jgi:hypothetical protein
MTERDTTPDDDRTQPEDVGGFRFGMADGGAGGDERPPTRADGAGADRSAGFDFGEWLGVSLSDLTEKVRGSDDPETTDTATAAEGLNFAGFDFGEWLGGYTPSTPLEPETDTIEGETETAAAVDPSAFDGFDFGAWLETTEAAAVETETPTDPQAERGPTYSGFDLRRWMADDGEIGPKKPPGTPRVVGARPDRTASRRARLLGLLPLVGSPDPVDRYPGGFDFTGWLAEGETSSGVIEPIEPEPETAATATETPAIEGPEYPTPRGGGITDTPPIKVAAFALFAASLVAVGLTLSGAVGALGPASGFTDPVPVDDADEQPVATATPTPEPTPSPTATPTATPTPTPSPTPTPTATPTPTPTPSPTPTATPEPTATATATPENGSVLDPITDPIFG